ncbi:glucosamine-6-phosphate deaminase [Vibrio sp. SS-MA-C1-2]|uniref:glucosamine-6-phosphate deaminase n=1 Tax=Vibrio sp. SS-MA-C1-2 TaxID=2908646 RepID=UPI001F341B6C|nr:glucosamine-6-phosphate deaminase [Vibrio sp. SS-MA-C1-2]UJF18271.1 glucosamine-6-phosphate deaminase [Vibrio sp. SS-MA-C1-2]
MMSELITLKKQDKLQFEVYNTRCSMGHAAAQKVREILVALQNKQDTIRIIFASAPSQNEFLMSLKEHQDIDWSKVVAFHMDEYTGLPSESPQSFSSYIKENLLDDVKPKEAHFIKADSSDAEAECIRYSELLNEAPIDLVCLGVGENGHIAFNDPWVADFTDSKVVKPVKLDELCRQQQVNDKCFDELSEVPTHALTLTIPTLFSAKYMVCIVPAMTKRNAITRMLNEGINEDLPASILRNHSNAYLYLDADSGADFI